jgi:hypothetical protein
MAKSQTEKSRYHSRYSQGFVTAAQYIIELICEKKARTENKDLPIFFWRLPEWEKFFVFQTRPANSLLKKYSADSIIKSLLDKRTWKTYSLYAPWLIPIIEEYEKLRKIIPEDYKPIEVIEQDEFILQVKKDPLSNLDE